MICIQKDQKTTSLTIYGLLFILYFLHHTHDLIGKRLLIPFFLYGLTISIQV